MKKTIRQTLCALLSLLMVAVLFAGCGKTDDKITVVSREDGSGTRGAFIELFGIDIGNIYFCANRKRSVMEAFRDRKIRIF